MAHLCLCLLTIALMDFPKFAQTTTTKFPGLEYSALVAISLTNYWRFNGDVKDIQTSISLFNQRRASSFVSDRFGRPRSALFINNGWIQMPVGYYFVGDHSTSLWLYLLKKTSAWQQVYIIQATNPSEIFFSLAASPLGQLQASLGRTDTSQLTLRNNRSVVGQWFHVGVSVWTTTVLNLYVNGVRVNQANIDASVSESLRNSIWRKHNFFGSANNNLNAYLDDVMFFGRGLSDLEMYAVANTDPTASYSTTTTTRTTTTPVFLPNVTHRWKFNGDVKDNVTGISLWGQHGQIAFVGDRRGRSRSALYINNGYLRMPNAFYFTTMAYSTALWMFVTSDIAQYQSHVVYVIGDDLTPGRSSSLAINSAQWLAANAEKGYLGVTGKYTRNREWTHVGVTLQIADTLVTIRLYVNGVLAGSSQLDYSYDRSFVNSKQTLCYFGIPANSYSQAPSVYLDDVMFFDAELTQSQMMMAMAIYDTLVYAQPASTKPTTTSTIATSTSTRGPSTVGYNVFGNCSNLWRFNDNYNDDYAGQALSDVTNLSFVTDRFGASMAAVWFASGTAQMPPGLVYVNGSEWTHALWVNVRELNPGPAQIYHLHSADSSYGLFFGYSGSGAIWTAWKNADDDSVTAETCTNLPLQTWTHLALTVVDVFATVYMNGEQQCTFTIRFHSNSKDTTQLTNGFFGQLTGESHISTAPLNAYIDQVVFFTNGKSSAEIYTIYYYSIMGYWL